MALKQFGERSVIGCDAHVSVTAIAAKTHQPVVPWEEAVRGDLGHASGGSANAIALPSGSGTFTWRTPFAYVWIGSCPTP